MKRSTKAALLSGLIFPGIGHLFLRHYVRGTVLALAALLATSIIVSSAYQQALAIVARIESGDIPLDPVAIAAMASNSSAGSNGFVETAALIVLLASWLLGIIDSCRLGALQEKQTPA